MRIYYLVAFALENLRDLQQKLSRNKFAQTSNVSFIFSLRVMLPAPLSLVENYCRTFFQNYELQDQITFNLDGRGTKRKIN